MMTEVESGFRIIARYLEHLAGKQGLENLYRGQANTVWEPTPTAFRAAQFGITSRLELDRWKAMAARFERAQSDLEWLVLAQHYGVATPLLDWTINPLVALFFASQHHTPQGIETPADGAVFMMPRSAAVKESNPRFDVFTNWTGPPLLVEAENMNRRSLAQASVMTLHCEGNHFMTPGHDARIWVVGAPEKRDILAALRTFGISNERIYDDLGVAARDFTEQLLQEGVSRIFGNPPRLPQQLTASTP